MPSLEGKADHLDREALYWRFGVQYRGASGRLETGQGGQRSPTRCSADIATDPGEQTDLTAREPDKAKALQALWDKWNATMQPPRWEDKRWNGEEIRAERKKAKKDK